MNSLPVVEAQMMIRKPVSLVFQAFFDPAVTVHFWFTKSSGPLVAGGTVIWEWEMYNFSTLVEVRDVVPEKRIVLAWGEPKTTIEIAFTPLQEDRTYVVIKNYGFAETGDDLVEVIKNNTGGFTTVLDGLKAYLEHNIQLNLIADKFANQPKQD